MEKMAAAAIITWFAVTLSMLLTTVQYWDNPGLWKGPKSCVRVLKVGAYPYKICHVGYQPHHLSMRRRNDFGSTHDGT